GPVNLTFDHNTIFQSGPIIVADGAPSSGFVFRNNIAPHNQYGVLGSGKGVGVSALNYYFPGASFHKNVVVGIPQRVSYPAGIFTHASLSQVGFVDLA